MIIDVSVYQKDIKWDLTAPNCEFAIIRASVGFNKDKKVDRNTAECDRLSLPYHLYHYIKYTTDEDVIKEANVFSEASMWKNPYYLVVDCEYGKITNAEKKKEGSAKHIVELFCETVKKNYAANFRGCPPIAVYIGNHVYKIWNLDYDKFAYVWIPRYSTKKPYYKCDLWQYTSNCKIAGIAGRCDASRLNGNKLITYFTNRYFDDYAYEGAFGGRTLAIGSKGNDVKELQEKLITLGYSLPNYGADGDFGYETKSALMRFEEEHEYDNDGVLDKEAYDVLMKEWHKHYPTYALLITGELEDLEDIQLEHGGKIVKLEDDIIIE